jgi:hypothetical protein
MDAHTDAHGKPLRTFLWESPFIVIRFCVTGPAQPVGPSCNINTLTPRPKPRIECITAQCDGCAHSGCSPGPAGRAFCAWKQRLAMMTPLTALRNPRSVLLDILNPFYSRLHTSTPPVSRHLGPAQTQILLLRRGRRTPDAHTDKEKRKGTVTGRPLNTRKTRTH